MYSFFKLQVSYSLFRFRSARFSLKQFSYSFLSKKNFFSFFVIFQSSRSLAKKITFTKN